VYEYIKGHGNRFLKFSLLGVFALQVGSGVLQVLQPFTNPVKSSALTPAWFDAMKYLRNNTGANSLLVYNRFQLKENYYKDDFDFVPVFAERPVVVGGKQYFPDYVEKKAKVDSLYSSSPENAKKISQDLQVDYIVFDKWKGGSFQGVDSTFMLPVYTNEQVDIFKVKRKY
jgi:hypothetical protein